MTARIDREQSITTQIEFNRISVENRPRVDAVRRMIAKSGVRAVRANILIYLYFLVHTFIFYGDYRRAVLNA